LRGQGLEREKLEIWGRGPGVLGLREGSLGCKIKRGGK